MEPTRNAGRVSRAARVRGSDTTPSHPRAHLRELLRALDDRGLGASARAVAVALWTHCDPVGRSWPSQQTIARLVGRGERTVRAAVKSLEAARVILRDVPRLDDRRRCRRTTVYRFVVGSWATSTGSPLPKPRGAVQTPTQGDARPPAVDATTEQPAGRHESVNAPSASPIEEKPEHPTDESPEHPCAQTEDVAPLPIAHEPDDAPRVAFVGWTLVDPVDDAPGSPATTATDSPATATARRSQGVKIPPPPAAPRGPNVARATPARARWASPSIPSAAARLLDLARRREAG